MKNIYFIVFILFLLLFLCLCSSILTFVLQFCYYLFVFLNILKQANKNNVLLLILYICFTSLIFFSEFYPVFLFDWQIMGIHNLAKLIADQAPGSIKEGEIKNYFGRKIAIDA